MECDVAIGVWPTSRPTPERTIVLVDDDGVTPRDLNFLVGKGGNLSRELINGPEIVRFQNCDQGSPRLSERSVVGLGERVEAAVWQGHVANTLVAAGGRGDPLGRAIGGPVIDDDLLQRAEGLGEYAFDARVDVTLGVVGGRDDRYQRPVGHVSGPQCIILALFSSGSGTEHLAAKLVP